MCGIVGYIGPKSVVPVIMEGLARLEYRGYDSAGIAVAGGEANELQLRRAPGKLRNLAEVLTTNPVAGTYGIGHTRWATHGRPTEENAHPHRDGTGSLVVVHNGIVENYLSLKNALMAKGHKFMSETDTEIIAHVIQEEFELAAAEAGLSTASAKSADSGRDDNAVVAAAPKPRRDYGFDIRMFAGDDSESESVISEESTLTTTTDAADTNESMAVLDEKRGTPDPVISLEEAVRRAVKRLTGAFAIGVLSSHSPNKMVAARLGPPIVLGLGDGEFFLASDVPGILHHTRDIYFLEDHEVATLTTDGIVLTDFDGKPKTLHPQRITWDPIQAEKGGYKHFMLKEIFEQPRSIRDTTLGRTSLDSGAVYLSEMKISDEEFRAATGINIAACGTSWHAALAGKYMIERLARVPVDVDYASEYRYRDPIADPGAIGLLITQSGETADTLAAQREMIAKGAKTIAICNVVGAAVAREAHGTIYTHAGPEIGVASTKAFTAQLVALFLFAMHLAQKRGAQSEVDSKALVDELNHVPRKVEEILRARAGECEQLALPYSTARDFLYLGRGIHFPIALEGALKLKEISYIHAEGYPAGEMKHGPNALIDETLPVVVLATKDDANPDSVLRYEKTLSNIQEVTARAGKVIAIATEGDAHIGQLVEHVLFIPPAPELLLPVLEVVPLQLLAYYIAVRRGCDVDQPRNLAKSVTVE